MTVVIKNKLIDGYEVAIQPSDKQFVLVPVDKYKELALDSKVYNALVAGGVDNWEWYDDVLQEVWKEIE